MIPLTSPALPAFIRVVYVLQLEYINFNDEGVDVETLVFNDRDAAIAEYDAQLNAIKTDENNWEKEAFITAVDEDTCDQEADDFEEPEFYYSEKDYTNLPRLKFDPISVDEQMRLKSFLLYCNGYYNEQHTRLTLYKQVLLGGKS